MQNCSDEKLKLDEVKEYFFNKYVEFCYPYQTSQKVSIYGYGVLKEYMDKRFTRDEIDKIICELIMKHPYVSGAMHLKLSISRFDSKTHYIEYYHFLTFKNDNYKNQEKGSVILFEK